MGDEPGFDNTEPAAAVAAPAAESERDSAAADAALPLTPPAAEYNAAVSAQLNELVGEQEQKTVGKAEAKSEAKSEETSDEEEIENHTLKSADKWGEGLVDDKTWREGNFKKPSVKVAVKNMKRHLYENGERSCLNTSVEQMDDMGVGISLYLQMLRTLGIVFMLMTLYAVPAFILNGESNGIPEGADPLYLVYFSLGNQGLHREQVSALGGCDVDGGPVNCRHAATVPRCGWVAGEPCFGPDFGCGSDVCIPQNINTTLTDDPLLASYWLSGADFMYSMVFLIFIIYFKIKIHEVIAVTDELKSTMGDFTVMVDGLPIDATDTSIRDFFNERYNLSKECDAYTNFCGCLTTKPRKLPPSATKSVQPVTDVRHLVARMDGTTTEDRTAKAESWRGSWVADVAIVTPLGLHVRKFIGLQKMWDKVLLRRAAIKRVQETADSETHPQKKAAKEKKLDNLNTKLEKLMLKVAKMQSGSGMSKIKGRQDECRGAFVVFNNEESKDRCLADYQSSHWSIGRLFQPKALRFVSKTTDKKTGQPVDKFHRLKVLEPPEPTNVQWEFLDTSDTDRSIRIGISNFIAFCLIMCSFGVIFLANVEKSRFQDQLPNLAMCQTEIPAVVFGGHGRVPLNIENSLQWDAELSETFCAEGEYYLSYANATLDASDPTVYSAKTSLYAGDTPLWVDGGKRLELAQDGRNLENWTKSWANMQVKVSNAVGTLTFCNSTCYDPNSDVQCPTLACLDEYAYMASSNHKCESYPLKSSIACYCSAALSKQIASKGSLWDGASEVMSNQPMCVAFVESYVSTQMLVIGAAVMVILVNTVLKTVLEALSKFEHHSSVSAEAVAVCSKVFVAQFINTGLIVLLVNMSFANTGLDWLFTGDISGFSHDWYTIVGVALMLNMCINIFAPHAPYLAQWVVIGPLMRTLFAGSKDTQDAQNRLFNGPEFNIAIRFPLILNTIFTCMFYCGGLPVLLPFAGITFTITFLVDKVLLLRMYKKPPQYDEKLAAFTVQLLPWALLGHLGMSFWMYGNDSTLMSDAFLSDETMANMNYEWDALGDEGFTPKLLRLNCLPIFLFGFALGMFMILKATFGPAVFRIILNYFRASYIIWKRFWRLASCGRLYGAQGSKSEPDTGTNSTVKVVPEAEQAAPAASAADAAAPAEGDEAAANTTVSDIALAIDPEPISPFVDAHAYSIKKGHPTYTGVFFEPMNPSIEVSPEEDFLHKMEAVLFAMGGIDRVVVVGTFALMCLLIAYFNTFVNMLLFLGFVLAAGFSITVALIWYKGKGIDVEQLQASRRKMDLDKKEVEEGWQLDVATNPKIAAKSKFYTDDGETYGVPHTAGQAMLTWEQMGIQDHSYRIMDVVKYRVALETMQVIDEQEAIKTKDDAVRVAAEEEAARLKAIEDEAAAKQKSIDDAAAVEAAAVDAAAAKQKEADDAPVDAPADAPATAIEILPPISSSGNAPLVLAETAGSPIGTSGAPAAPVAEAASAAEV
jgi:hypothetical protein